MLTNRQIKRKELFKAQQNLIRCLGDFKQAQNEMLLSFNECFAAEYYRENALKKGIAEMRMKAAIKRYAQIYKHKLALEEAIADLKAWQPAEEAGDK